MRRSAWLCLSAVWLAGCACGSLIVSGNDGLCVTSAEMRLPVGRHVEPDLGVRAGLSRFLGSADATVQYDYGTEVTETGRWDATVVHVSFGSWGVCQPFGEEARLYAGLLVVDSSYRPSPAGDDIDKRLGAALLGFFLSADVTETAFFTANVWAATNMSTGGGFGFEAAVQFRVRNLTSLSAGWRLFSVGIGDEYPNIGLLTHGPMAGLSVFF